MPSIQKKSFSGLSFILLFIFAGGCTVGPNYVKPTAEVPSNFKEVSPPFEQAQPADAVAKGKWWEIYNDPQLNDLEEQVDVANQTLKAQQDTYFYARSAVRVARAQYFPTVTGGISATHFSQSSNRPTAGPVSNYQDYLLPVDASWEPDFWGRVRRNVEAARSEEQASAADLANVSLDLHAELAMDYFELRGLDAMKELLDSTVVSYQKALDLTQSRYQGGVASAVDVAQAQTQLETTRSEDQDVAVNRAVYEHAIAQLVGKPASEFSLPPISLKYPPPPIPVGLPSELLERRPDVAAAERRVEEANAEIGVARSAYFPNVTLSAAGGFESGAIGTLIQGPSGVWSLAGSAAELIFDGGARRGAGEEARANFDRSVAEYRQTVLTSFEEVEDYLATLRILAEESKTQDAAVTAAQHSLDLSNNRYKGGVANYLEVTTAQSAALSDEVAALNILIRRMSASAQLVKAIGGGWNISQLPHS